MKNYYQILGVLDDAEDVVIRAAYRALAQKYHPDKWKGSPEDATAKMGQINKAYETLIDPLKRSAYDKTINRSQYEQDRADEDDLIANIDDDWKRVVEFLPSVDAAARDLARLSRSLEYSFKLLLLETKQFNSCVAISKQLESGFLNKFFGANQKIHMFAKSLLYAGRRSDAKKLNEAVVLLGSEVDPMIIIRKIDPAYESKIHWSNWGSDNSNTSHEKSNVPKSNSRKSKVFLWDSSIFNPIGKIVLLLIAILFAFAILSALFNKPQKNAVNSVEPIYEKKKALPNTEIGIRTDSHRKEFDFDGAQKAGYSDSEVVKYLSSQQWNGFDFEAAKRAGYSDKQIIDYFKSQQN